MLARLLLAMALCGFSSCEKKAPVSAKPSPTPNDPTAVLQAADLVGYDGKALQRQVKGLVETNAAREKELQKVTGQ